MHLIARLLNPTSGEEFHSHQLKSWLPIQQLLQLCIRLNQIPLWSPASSAMLEDAVLLLPLSGSSVLLLLC